MAKISVGASVYRVARRKSEIARDEKWQRTAKLASKKSLDLKKRKPAEEGTEKPESPGPAKAPELIEPKAPDNKKGR